MTPCAGENVRVTGAILLPAIVRRRPDCMILPAAHFFYRKTAAANQDSIILMSAFAKGKVEIEHDKRCTNFICGFS